MTLRRRPRPASHGAVRRHIVGLSGIALCLSISGCGPTGLSAAYSRRIGPQDDLGKFLSWVAAEVGREGPITSEELRRVLRSGSFTCEGGSEPQECACQAPLRVLAYSVAFIGFYPVYDDAVVRVTARENTPGWWIFPDASFRRLTDRWGGEEHRAAVQRRAGAGQASAK